MRKLVLVIVVVVGLAVPGIGFCSDHYWDGYDDAKSGQGEWSNNPKYQDGYEDGIIEKKAQDNGEKMWEQENLRMSQVNSVQSGTIQPYVPVSAISKPSVDKSKWGQRVRNNPRISKVIGADTDKVEAKPFKFPRGITFWRGKRIHAYCGGY